MKKQLEKFYQSFKDNKNPYIAMSVVLKKNSNYKFLKEWIIEQTSLFPDDTSMKVRLQYLLFGFPKCVYCGNPIKQLNKKHSNFLQYCSKECKNKSSNEKRKKTNKEKYGVEYLLQDKDFQNKFQQNMKEKYGVENYPQHKDWYRKTEKTMKEKYGDWNFNVQRKQIKQTWMQKYGVDNPQKSEIVKKKTKQTNLKKFGVGTNLLLSENKNKSLLSRLNNLYDHANLWNDKETWKQFFDENNIFRVEKCIKFFNIKNYPIIRKKLKDDASNPRYLKTQYGIGYKLVI